MIYEIEYIPRFRESGHDGLVGLKGYMDYFQDIAAGQYHVLDKDNCTIHEQYGVAWVYAKYRLKIHDKADFDHPLRIRAWISRLDAVRSWQEMEVFCGDRLLCEGRLESCLIDIKDHTIARIPRIELPDGLAVDRMTAAEPFTRRMKLSDDAVYRYTHTVRYTEIDNNRHMNNLYYVPLFMNAFDVDFYDRHRITDFELQYIRQAYCGEQLDVCAIENDGEVRLYALNRDRELVAGCVMKTEALA
jgi:medium-chain acyl-[acyl-carrier-protein] hydrolase